MTATPKAGRTEWTGFAVLALPLLLVSMDVSVLFFAVPFLSRELNPTATQQLWIFDIYGFVLSGLLITMGALGDRIGRRRLLLIGAAGFSAASVLAAYSTSAEMLILARALLGIGGATLMPSTLALVRTMFHDARQRTTAIALWTGIMTGGIALGPILSGVLLEHFWWGSVFLINLPAMALLLLLAPLLVPESRDPRPARFDLLGAALSLAAVLPVVWGIKELARSGWAVPPVVALAAGTIAGALFVRRQRVTRSLFDPALFRRRTFTASLALNVISAFAIVGFAIFTTQYLQSVLGYSPLRAALWSLVPSVLVGGAAPLAAVLARKVDRSVVLTAGFTVAAAGFVVLTQVPARHGLVTILIGAGVYAAGLVMAMSLLTELVVGEAPPERAGAVAALLESSSELGGALGIALLGSLGAAVYRHDMAGAPEAPDGAAGAAGAARETLGGALAAASHQPGDAGRALVDAARDAFCSGMHLAAAGGAAVMVAGAILSAIALRGSGRVGAQPVPPAQPVPATQPVPPARPAPADADA